MTLLSNVIDPAEISRALSPYLQCPPNPGKRKPPLPGHIALSAQSPVDQAVHLGIVLRAVSLRLSDPALDRRFAAKDESTLEVHV
jgi:hypothetical protein